MTSTCPNCGATATTPDARHCSYCGAALPAASGRPPSRAGRLAAVRAHATLGELMRHRPSAAGHLVGSACSVAFLAVFLAVALFMLVMFQGMSSGGVGGTLFGLFPLIFVAAGVVLLVVVLRRTGRFVSSPLERVVSLVVDERTEVSGGHGDSSASTSYYVTLEREDGERQEYATTGSVAGRVARDDVGMAYLKGDTLLDFKRVPV